jgi:hypothetical protein
MLGLYLLMVPSVLALACFVIDEVVDEVAHYGHGTRA